MLKRSIGITIIVTLLAGIGGVIAGRYFANTTTGTAYAQDQRIQPDWKDLQITYLTLHEESKIDKNTLAEVNINVLNSRESIVTQARNQGIDILVIDKSALQILDSTWAVGQYKDGTAFVGLNITTDDLGTLIADPYFIKEGGGKKPVEPFVSVALVKVDGNPDHIKLLADKNMLYPPDVEGRLAMGIDDVFISTVQGYMPLTNTNKDLISALNNIRLSLDKNNLVRP